MEAFQVLMLIYLVPAGALVGITILVVLVRRKPLLLPFEYVSWVLPGLTYWFLFGPLDLEQAFRGKTCGNIGEPGVVGVITGFLFVARVVIGALNPRWNKIAALCCLVGSNLAALGVLVLMPELPE